LVEGEEHVVHTAKKPEPEIPERVRIPDYAHLLPEEIRPFTTTIQDAAHLSFIQGAGHGGSHPHLVNEFIRALLEDRDPWPNATQSANWTCTGICAHQSAMRGRRLPAFTLDSGSDGVVWFSGTRNARGEDYGRITGLRSSAVPA
jgi:hypothetical protein